MDIKAQKDIVVVKQCKDANTAASALFSTLMLGKYSNIWLLFDILFCQEPN
jgi:hypothetical protein